MLCLLDNTKTCRPICQTGEDLRFGEVDLEVPPVDQETMAPPDVPLFPSGTVVTQLQNTSARLSSTPNPVSASSARKSDVQIGESSLTPGTQRFDPQSGRIGSKFSGKCRYCN